MIKKQSLAGLIALLLLAACASNQLPVEEQITTSLEASPVPETITPEEPETSVIIDEPPSAEEMTEAIQESSEMSAPTDAIEVVDQSFFGPDLTYEGAYNGPLYATSEQIGTEAPITKHIQNLNRNGVNVILAFFSIDSTPTASNLLSHDDLGYALTAVKNHPGRFVPFFSLALGEDAAKLVGPKLTSWHEDVLQGIQSVAGNNFIRGIGELDTYGWDMRPNDPRMASLFDVAKDNNLAVLIHVAEGQVNDLGKLAASRPETTFLVHAFPLDFEIERQKYIDLVKNNKNIYFSIDADHMMFSDGTGLLYKWEAFDDPTNVHTYNMGISQFVAEYDKKESQLLSLAVQRYKPLVLAAPDKVMWGTEQGLHYTYEPQVFDRTVKFSRLFIGQMPEEMQEGLAYKNAFRVFGTGVTVAGDFNIADTSKWPICTDKGMPKWVDCEDKCESDHTVDTPEAEACLSDCAVQYKCIAEIEDD